MKETYENQVQLLLSVLPFIAEESCFAIKGGTAINFFWRDFPRLSVDIDLTYLPVKDRTSTLKDIETRIRKIAESISQSEDGLNVTAQASGGTLSKLFIQSREAMVKVEVNTVLRGSIFSAIEKELVPKVQELFESYISMTTLSKEDLYGGKLCAALDRQHPRDFFDVKLLLNNEGITDQIKTSFIGYLVSHSRPMNELLNPHFLDISDAYKNEFTGMAINEVQLEELIRVQEELPGRLLNKLTDIDKAFILSFKKGTPEWDLFPVKQLRDLPGVKWKLLNIRKMDRRKHKESYEKLGRVLYA